MFMAVCYLRIKNYKYDQISALHFKHIYLFRNDSYLRGGGGGHGWALRLKSSLQAD